MTVWQQRGIIAAIIAGLLALILLGIFRGTERANAGPLAQATAVSNTYTFAHSKIGGAFFPFLEIYNPIDSGVVIELKELMLGLDKDDAVR